MIAIPSIKVYIILMTEVINDIGFDVLRKKKYNAIATTTSRIKMKLHPDNSAKKSDLLAIKFCKVISGESTTKLLWA